MLNLFNRTRKPASPDPVTGSLQIRNLLDDPQLQAVMTTAPVAAGPVVAVPVTSTSGDATRMTRWRSRVDDAKLLGAA